MTKSAEAEIGRIDIGHGSDSRAAVLYPHSRFEIAVKRAHGCETYREFRAVSFASERHFLTFGFSHRVGQLCRTFYFLPIGLEYNVVFSYSRTVSGIFLA